MQAIEAVVERLARAPWREREALKNELLALGRQQPDPVAVANHLEDLLRTVQSLEVRWEIEEVIEILRPPKPPEAPAPEPEPEPEAPEDPNRPLQASDLDLVYDDPRGLLLHRSKKGNRWFVTQVDPYSGRPQTAELHPSQVAQVKQQLAGSPYWVLGAGAR